MENITPPAMTGTAPTLTDSVTVPPEDDNTAAPASSTPADSPRQLALWELMRKDDNPASPPPAADETDRVLSSTRPSIWDLD